MAEQTTKPKTAMYAVYARRFDVERPTHRYRRPISYSWRPGYVEVTETGALVFPALTRWEACRQARSEGKIPRFFKTEQQAVDFWRKEGRRPDGPG